MNKPTISPEILANLKADVIRVETYPVRVFKGQDKDLVPLSLRIYIYSEGKWVYDNEKGKRIRKTPLSLSHWVNNKMDYWDKTKVPYAIKIYRGDRYVQYCNFVIKEDGFEHENHLTNRKVYDF